MSDTNAKKISNREAIWFFITLFISKILFADISRYVSQSGTSAYMQTAWCGILALLLFFLSVVFSKKGDLLGAVTHSFGPNAEKILGIVLVGMLLFYTGMMLRVYADIIGSVVLPDFPDFLIIALLALTILVSGFSGLGTVVSYAYGAGIVIVSALLLILFLNIPNYDMTNIYPILGNGIGSILKGVNGVGAYADIFLIFLISPYLKKGASVGKIGFKAIIISAVLITITTFLYILTVGYPASSYFSLPVLEIAFDVNLEVVFQRAEGIFLFMWILSGFVLTGAYMCIAVELFKKCFHLSDRRGSIGLFVFISTCIGLIFESTVKYKHVYDGFYTFFTITAFALPLIVFIIYKIRGKRKI